MLGWVWRGGRLSCYDLVELRFYGLSMILQIVAEESEGLSDTKQVDRPCRPWSWTIQAPGAYHSACRWWQSCKYSADPLQALFSTQLWHFAIPRTIIFPDQIAYECTCVFSSTLLRGCSRAFPTEPARMRWCVVEVDLSMTSPQGVGLDQQYDERKPALVSTCNAACLRLDTRRRRYRRRVFKPGLKIYVRGRRDACRLTVRTLCSSTTHSSTVSLQHSSASATCQTFLKITIYIS